MNAAPDKLPSSPRTLWKMEGAGWALPKQLRKRFHMLSKSLPGSGTTRAALGFRAHSGWAAMVALAGPVRAPVVIERRRIELAPPEVPRPVQPYHAAQKLTLAEAEEYVRYFTQQAQLLATQTLREMIERLAAEGHRATACGAPLGAGRPVPSLEVALASHTMLHTAEGELFRRALIVAGEKNGLSILGIRERDLIERGAGQFGISPKILSNRLVELGQGLGPPWGQDQKVATLAAWLALASDSAHSQGRVK
jgi:hypothetical protein